MKVKQFKALYLRHRAQSICDVVFIKDGDMTVLKDDDEIGDRMVLIRPKEKIVQEEITIDIPADVYRFIAEYAQKNRMIFDEAMEEMIKKSLETNKEHI